MLAALWHRRPIVAALAMMGCAATIAAEPGFHRLSGEGIRLALVDKTVTDDAHWADHFLPDGVLDSHELGEARRGAWVIEHRQLCLTRKARRPIKECFEVWMKGDQVEYRRDGVGVMAGTIRDLPNRPR
ncbi:MAG: hypothetical protein PHR35_23490 [Kiritimatiellae bacterium]|nr:hypothetical protein [Kiritimatiellia bacterium]